MFFEKCGKFFFSQMRPLFFFALCTFPLFATAFILFNEYNELQDLETRFSRALRKEKLSLAKKGRKERFLKRYSSPSPYFLDQNIESLTLLNEEAEKLQSILSHPAFPDSRSIKSRLAFLKDNRLSFIEENIRTSAKIKEVEEKLRNPVQLDENDLKKVLSLIEDVEIDNFTPIDHCPQMIIKDFRLKKQETSLHTELFEVEMDLIKREFTSS
ncbi:MAG: hypothetical protein COT85_08140 [Chlamydiae bacterium CG10_big_fil_rev_8_21_14_0_10_42_34]|nr:MAG: hypothetical protein COT85_08140 [Chlamydiae bacterium CG10_big_fil_rev_8_21_14_0_10_42_34]